MSFIGFSGLNSISIRFQFDFNSILPGFFTSSSFLDISTRFYCLGWGFEEILWADLYDRLRLMKQKNGTLDCFQRYFHHIWPGLDWIELLFVFQYSNPRIPLNNITTSNSTTNRGTNWNNHSESHRNWYEWCWQW